ncbi:MAG TPA: hypothetical protein PLG42_10220 [Bacteroidales bacterium]|nr:hypothetical protein [Bacteroidales bacterium]
MEKNIKYRLWESNEFLDFVRGDSCESRSFFWRDMEELRKKLDEQKELRRILMSGKNVIVEKGYYIGDRFFLVNWAYSFVQAKGVFMFGIVRVLETECGSENHPLLVNAFIPVNFQ